tara:strand:- start:309 stop:458 length:150 start_codon:yes stop_codon:yes gene_type:complete
MADMQMESHKNRLQSNQHDSKHDFWAIDERKKTIRNQSFDAKQTDKSNQ